MTSRHEGIAQCSYVASDAPLPESREAATLVRRLAASEVQKGLPAGVDERVAAGTFPAVQDEDESTVGTALKLPPAGVGDALGVVFKGRVVNLVVLDRYGEPIVRVVLGQSLGDGPRAQHAILLQPQVEVVPWPIVLVEDEHGSV